MKTSPYGTWHCGYCNEIFRTRAELFKHAKIHHSTNGKSWNAGKTAKDDPRIAKIGKTLKERYNAKEIVPTWLGRKHTEEQKKAKQYNLDFANA
jgi:hypothetical protein